MFNGATEQLFPPLIRTSFSDPMMLHFGRGLRPWVKIVANVRMTCAWIEVLNGS